MGENYTKPASKLQPSEQVRVQQVIAPAQCGKMQRLIELITEHKFTLEDIALMGEMLRDEKTAELAQECIDNSLHVSLALRPWMADTVLFIYKDNHYRVPKGDPLFPAIYTVLQDGCTVEWIDDELTDGELATAALLPPEWLTSKQKKRLLHVLLCILPDGWTHSWLTSPKSPVRISTSERQFLIKHMGKWLHYNVDAPRRGEYAYML